MKGALLEFLFATGAIKVASEGEMFIFTSGLISPYYVSTHFLCGGEKASTDILSLIDSFKGRPEKIISEVAPRINELSLSDPVYKDVVSQMKLVAKEYVATDDIKFVSGGERRDWFFSIPLARELGLNHLFLFNDGLVLDGAGNRIEIQKEKIKVIHAADLLTVGSSYTGKWIPALSLFNFEIGLSINCVDRVQGGQQNLKAAGVGEVISLCSIDEEFFEAARVANVITDDQKKQMRGFFVDQHDSMRQFLLANPEFVKRSLCQDEKTKARMLITLNEDLYKLGSSYVSDVLAVLN